jgi:hypothetical protein
MTMLISVSSLWTTYTQNPARNSIDENFICCVAANCSECCFGGEQQVGGPLEAQLP